MTYDTECTGTPVLDINRPKAENGGPRIYKGSSMAMRIVPTSRCLDFITFLGIKRYTTSAMVIEVRENDTTLNLPKGSPGSSDGLIGSKTVPYTDIPDVFGDANITLGVLLPIANTAYWIVIYSSDFVCDINQVGEGHERFELSYDASNDPSLVNYGQITPPQCNWASVVPKSWALQTYKKTYVPPPPTGTLHFVVTSGGTAIEGVSISVDNISKGVTNSSGILDVSNLTLGTSHSYTASKSGYTTVSSSVTLDSTPKTVPVSMTTGGGGVSAGAVVGIVVAVGFAAAIIYVATRRRE